MGGVDVYRTAGLNGGVFDGIGEVDRPQESSGVGVGW